MKKNKYFSKILVLLIVVLVGTTLSSMMGPQKQKGIVPTTINDFFLPGSQPLESGTFANPDQCVNCHGNNLPLETQPSFQWRGSMMSQAQRDPLYLATLVIANQDAPESGDLCIRCHTPKGWLEGRSEPTDGSALLADDRHSVQCTFCHRMIAPTQVGVNPYPFDIDYITQPGNKDDTYTLDQDYLATLPNIPPMSANGMYVCDDQDTRRGPLFDPQANHDTPYSPFHPDANICGTCHDVSNPAFSTVRNEQNEIIGYAPNDFDTPAPSFETYDLFPVERTFSEWLVSEYNTPGGVTGTWFGGNKSFVSTCQDCHMRDVTGKACNKNYAPVHDDLPKHDMTGGNTFVPDLIESVFPGEADLAALEDGKLRARDMLQHAATVKLTVDQLGQLVTVKINNETGHKLPSGYPEGRRIWINLKAFNSLTAESYESGYYDPATGILDKSGTKIYEIKPGISPDLAAITGLTAGPSFHFVLNDSIYSDNRIPPRGFTNHKFDSIQSPPVGYSYEDGEYWDDTEYLLPFIPDSVDVSLLYQTTSKEYVEFLRDENVTDTTGQFMYNLWVAHGRSAPEIMNNETWSGPPVLLSAKLDVTALLEGPFDGSVMSTAINERNNLPLVQPYNSAPWFYSGDETVADIPGSNIVDWILMELRETPGDVSTATSSTMVAQKAVFLLDNGKIVDLDGISEVEFDIAVSDNLFVVLWHRNHLGVISSIPLEMEGGIYIYDFSISVDQAYGGITGHKEIAAGIWGMVAADGDANGIVDLVDKSNVWMLETGLEGYYAGDFNMDVQVDNKDKNDRWYNNTSATGQVPEYVPEIIYSCWIPK